MILPATRFNCPSCLREFKLHVKVLPFYCPCGARLDEIKYLAVNPYEPPFQPKPKVDLPCIHRGDKLREINCGCSGKQYIYSCAKHGECFLRKLPKMPRDEIQGKSMCLDCDDRRMFRRGWLGVAAVTHNQVGGTETYWRLLDSAFELAGVAVSGKPREVRTSYPVHHGNEAIEELANEVDYLIVWGITDAEELTRGPMRIAMHHGSLASTWANHVFENQLKWCELAVAVNEDVARHYGVPCIGNVVDIASLQRETYPVCKPIGKKVVFWCHRDAIEKRPHLARHIADKLPDDWILVATLPSKYQGKNMRCIGTIDNPQAWLEVADVFLSTADQEAFGYSIAEAMVLNVPVVAGPYGIAQDPQLVWQVDNEDPQAWVDAILLANSCRHWKKGAIERWKVSMSLDAFRAKWNFILSLPLGQASK